MSFGLKNVGATFQRAINFDFHDINHIVKPYLDDLPNHSRKRKDHLEHLRLVFERCWHYSIRLNPHKCVFCVDLRWLLSFIVSNKGIKVDSLKVEVIITLPAPRNIRHLQILQCKSNFLRWFIVNYAKIIKGFMRLLKQYSPFICDESSQQSFEALRRAFLSAPLLGPLDYTKNFLYCIWLNHTLWLG